jgi:hypothetical protein
VARARQDHPGPIVLTGFEYSRGPNLLFLGQTVPPLRALSLPDARAAAAELLTIVAHPRPRPPEVYWSRDLVAGLGRLPDGVEVFNGHYGVPAKTAAGHGGSVWLQPVLRSPDPQAGT